MNSRPIAYPSNGVIAGQEYGTGAKRLIQARAVARRAKRANLLALSYSNPRE